MGWDGPEELAFIVNPHSGGGGGDRLYTHIAPMVREHGIQVATFETTLHGAAWAVEKALDTGFREIWVIGGDGTIQQCLHQIIEAGAVLGPIPAGTGNSLVEIIGHSANPVAQARWMLQQPVVSIDVGACNDHLFSIRAGVGFEAKVAREVEDDKSGLGYLAYAVAGLRAAGRAQPYSCTLRSEGEVIYEGDMLAAIFSNVPLRSYLQMPGRRVADPADGKLHTLIVRQRPNLAALWSWVRGERVSPEDAAAVMEHAAPTFELSVDGGAEVHLDGETAGEADSFLCEVRPQALRVRGVKPSGTPDA